MLITTARVVLAEQMWLAGMQVKNHEGKNAGVRALGAPKKNMFYQD